MNYAACSCGGVAVYCNEETADILAAVYKAEPLGQVIDWTIAIHIGDGYKFIDVFSRICALRLPGLRCRPSQLLGVFA